MGSQARVTQYQCAHFVRGSVAYNTANVATGVVIGHIPAGARISVVRQYVETAQNAGTTNTYSVGTVPELNGTATVALAAQSQLVSAAAAGTATYATTIPPITAVVAATDLAIVVSLAQSGTAATAGVLTVVVEYIPNL